MQQDISILEFYGDLVYELKKTIGNPNFSDLNRFEKAGYDLEIMRHTACLVFKPIMVKSFVALFCFMGVVQASDSMTALMRSFK